MAGNRGPTIALQMIRKSREAAMNAVQTFNNPLTTFKTETFIVLMGIAWTYLLHAHYRTEGVEYRYYRQMAKRRRFDRTKSGSYKYWGLEDCIKDPRCPLDDTTKINILFLIGLRNEIEHHQSVGVDQMLSSRYLACCLNFERYITEIFGRQYSLEESMAFALYFRDLTSAVKPFEAAAPLPSNVSSYIQEFDSKISAQDLVSQQFRRRYLFVPLVTSKSAQADEVIEFVSPDSDLAKAINDDYQQIFLKEVEKPKYLPSKIVQLMNAEGFPGFTRQRHIELWKAIDGKNPAKGYGYELGGRWFWYDRWLAVVRKHCTENLENYRSGLSEEAA